MISNNNLVKFKITQGSLRAEEIVFHHNNNEEVGFTLGEESDGTKRLIELLSIFCNLNGPKVYIVDELDRSLHPLLVRKLVEKYLELVQEKDVKTQLIVTTHETNILDLDLVRRDEIWFIERDARGVSSLYTLDEFKVHHLKKIDRAYLIGRYGSIPEFESLDNNRGSYNI
jgi:AAA15 family ATPase/GTPase